MLQTLPYPWRSLGGCPCKKPCTSGRYRTGKYLWCEALEGLGPWFDLRDSVRLENFDVEGYCWWGYEDDPVNEYGPYHRSLRISFRQVADGTGVPTEWDFLWNVGRTFFPTFQIQYYQQIIVEDQWPCNEIPDFEPDLVIDLNSWQFPAGYSLGDVSTLWGQSGKSPF